MVLSPTPVALWVLPVGDLGGVARHAVDTAWAGIPGFRPVFLVPHGPVVRALHEVGAEVRVAPIGPAHGAVRSVRSLRSAARELRPAVVHTHLAHADLAGALARPFLAGARLISTEHGIAGDAAVYHRHGLQSRAMAALHHWRLGRTDVLIAVAHATLAAAEAAWRPPARLPRHVVPNGVDRTTDARPAAEPGRGLHVVSLARLAPEKRLPQLLAGFARLLDRRPEARLTLAGDGPMAGELRRRVGELGLEHRVALPGHLPPGPLLESADVMALLSAWENCSYAVLDALVHGVGVVAAPVGGNPELLPAHCLVDPSDPDTVAETLVAQGENPSARPRLGPEWPTPSEMTRRLAAIYREALR